MCTHLSGAMVVVCACSACNPLVSPALTHFAFYPSIHPPITQDDSIQINEQKTENSGVPQVWVLFGESICMYLSMAGECIWRAYLLILGTKTRGMSTNEHAAARSAPHVYGLAQLHAARYNAS